MIYQTKKIIIIDNSDLSYSGEDIDGNILRGTETSLILLAEQFAKMSIHVDFCNSINKHLNVNGVNYFHKNNINKKIIYDLAIVISDANEFKRVSSIKKAVFSNSNQPIEKFIRKKQLFSFFKHRPKMILEGEYHYNTRSFLTSFFGKKILPIAVDYDFTNIKLNLPDIKNKNAIFTTRSDRNLSFLIDCWAHIKKNSKESKLFINPPYNLTEQDKKNHIQLREKGSKKDLIKDLINSRLMLNPGHKGEVFCLAAEEARELCVPIVTMGYGALFERVEHGISGFIARNQEEFIKYSTDILNDDNLFLKLQKNLSLKRNSRSYKDVANDFLKLIYES